MRIQKIIKAAALILFLCASTVESAQARIVFSGSHHSSSSSSFKSGFSSHKYSAPSQSTDHSSGRSTSFGSFGAAGHAAVPPTTSPATKSALSKDLNTTTANSTALNTYDARTKAAAPSVPAASPSYSAGGSTPGGYSNPPMYAQNQMPHTVIVQRDSGFSASPFLWFMLGHSMASQNHDRVVYERPAYMSGGDQAANGQVAADGNPVQATVPAEPQESFGAKVLRVLLWLTILGALAAGVLYLLAKRAARAVAAKTHYSLGKI